MRTSLSTVILVGLAAPAMAGGLAEPAETQVVPSEVVSMPTSNSDWTGAYAGVQLGYLHGNASVDVTAETDEFRLDPDPSGATAGIFAGYNWQLSGPFMIGVEGEYNWSHANGFDDLSVALGPTDLIRAEDLSINSTAALRARAGYTAGSTLFYAAAGWAYADYEMEYISEVAGISTTSQTFSGDLTGWTAGIGVEHALSNDWVVRVDYRYSDFGSFDFGEIETGGAGPGASVSGELTTQEFRLGLARRF